MGGYVLLALLRDLSNRWGRLMLIDTRPDPDSAEGAGEPDEGRD